MPDRLHILPVSDDTAFDGVFDAENTSLSLGLVADKMITCDHGGRDHFLVRERIKKKKKNNDTIAKTFQKST